MGCTKCERDSLAINNSNEGGCVTTRLRIVPLCRYDIYGLVAALNKIDENPVERPIGMS